MPLSGTCPKRGDSMPGKSKPTPSLKRPNWRQLEKVFVEIVSADGWGWYLRCTKCGAEWLGKWVYDSSLYGSMHGLRKMQPLFWRCPRGCNKASRR